MAAAHGRDGTRRILGDLGGARGADGSRGGGRIGASARAACTAAMAAAAGVTRPYTIGSLGVGGGRWEIYLYLGITYRSAVQSTERTPTYEYSMYT